MESLSTLDTYIVMIAALIVGVWAGIEFYLNTYQPDENGEAPFEWATCVSYAWRLFVLICIVTGFLAFGCGSIKASLTNEMVPLLVGNLSGSCSGTAALLQGIVVLLCDAAVFAGIYFASVHPFAKVRLCLLMVLTIGLTIV